jgi:glucuronokinase
LCEVNFVIIRLFSLLNENFDTRLSIYGKEALGSANLEMVDIARRHGSCAKFCGSGGAIFGVCLDDKKRVRFQGPSVCSRTR